MPLTPARLSLLFSQPIESLVHRQNASLHGSPCLSDMVETEEHATWSKPIGITYDADTREVWVSSYSGAIQVFADLAP